MAWCCWRRQLCGLTFQGAQETRIEAAINSCIYAGVLFSSTDAGNIDGVAGDERSEPPANCEDTFSSAAVIQAEMKMQPVAQY